MSRVFEEAIAQYRKTEGIVHVAHPEVDQRVTILARNEAKHFVPCLATIRRVFKAKVLADHYIDTSVPYYAVRANIWTWADPAPGSWHATRDGEPLTA